MKTTDSESKTSVSLRQRAEARLRTTSAQRHSQLSEVEILKLIHELEVHHIELEIQNEELVQSIAAEQDAVELYDFAPMGYFTLSKDREIIKLNLYGSQMLGKERSYLIDRRFDVFISDDTKPVFNLFIDNLFASKTKENCEVTLRGNEGNPLFVHLTGIAAKNGEQCLMTAADITERKKADTALYTIQRLESLGVLVAGIAHNFNNLMCGIYGYIDLAKNESDKSLSSEYLSKAMATIDLSRSLTDQLLTFAKGGAPARKTGHLFPFVQSTTKLALSGSNVSCRFAIPKNLWACNFDKNQIGQVVDNLIINARQAMPDGGAIELTARNVALQDKEHPLLAKGMYVKISIRDTGAGIPKELLARIFDPFFTTSKTQHGLGLSICYSIVNKHDGCIDVESEPGKGSTFHVFLPASTDSVASSPVKSSTVHKGIGTFLVMDDDTIIRETVGKMLVAMGYTVVCKENGQDAVDFYTKEIEGNRTVSGMILGLTVPGGLGGKAAVAKIRKLNENIPVFATSGYADDPVMLHSAEYGFTASICKPFSSSELSELLEKHLLKRRDFGSPEDKIPKTEIGRYK